MIIADNSTEIQELDEQARRAALDPVQSFIVQAPAGSGKTELLTQRYLALLAQACESPEEIIAITFTRKAAAQMRERVISALQLAQQDEPPAVAHRLLAWQLARAVLQKNQQHHWQLLENPQRLRIFTIDALCGQLSSRLPLLAGYGAPTQIVDDATPYYQQAVRELLLHATPVKLLMHLDNHTEKLMQLCVELLGKREQWLPYIVYSTNPATLPQLRKQLEQGLAQLVQETLEATQLQLKGIATALLPLLRFAGNNLQSKQPSHPLASWADRDQFPLPIAPELTSWRGLAHALLTLKGEWRKTVDIRIGFPPKTSEKIVFEQLLTKLTEQDGLAESLRQILHCPPIQYEDKQWQIVATLIEVLPLLAAQLQLIFQQHGVMDFIELGLSASKALGEEQQPTDLALSWDYRIRHLLVDEFQDTSVAQFKLLEKLLWGWEPQDGRTVFLVGDPMQSIYRFRNAEVGLFLRATHQGIQQVQLRSLSLTLNFRSSATLVDWYNRIFPQLLPATADLATGAIPYTPAAAAISSSAQLNRPQQAVYCHAFTGSTSEAEHIVQLIQQYRQHNAQATIAVLVRSRSHLLSIIPALQTQQIKFQAVEIEPLLERAEIQDLLALTRALHHGADRIAWLAVLRAPYCGLRLADLHLLAQQAEHKTIAEVLLQFQQLPDLSDDAQQRLQRVVPVLSQAFFKRGRLPLAEWIENTWLALGGPAGLTHTHELANTAAYFKLLMELQQQQILFNLPLLQQRLQNLYAAPDAKADARLQIMTIHKAKGLEFDHVILPELQRKPTADKSRLLLWMERAQAHGGAQLVLAPIKAAGVAADPLYEYLQQVEQQKLQYEARRLLYVAATRAKQSLHLLAVLPPAPVISEWQPVNGSFLSMLWPYFYSQLPTDWASNATVVTTSVEPATGLHRLCADWQNPLHELNQPDEHPARNHQPDFMDYRHTSPEPSNLSLLTTRCASGGFTVDYTHAWIGIVIHAAMMELAEQAPAFPTINNLRPRWRRQLLQLGLPATQLATALSTVEQAVQNILQDPRGLWILSAEHQDRHNEYALSAVINRQIIHVVIDRTFIDANGVRWIIDYKTSDPAADLAPYHAQLHRYAQVMALGESHPTHLALYFPLSRTWQEYQPSR